MKFSIRKYLLQKFKITVNKALTDEPLWHTNVSRLSAGLTVIIISVAIFTAAVYLTLKTPLANYIPGFHGKEAQMQLVEALISLDSLSDKVARWEAYNNNILLVLEGGNTIQEDIESAISKEERKVSKKAIIDSIFRDRILKDTIYVGKKTRRKLFELLPPSSGMITASFNPKEGQNGISITPPPNGTILSIMDGTIISTSWDPGIGWTIVIQHAGGMISVYKHIASLLQKSGQRITAGEAIGLASSLESGSTPKLVLELWYNGYLVDPENYITF